METKNLSALFPSYKIAYKCSDSLPLLGTSVYLCFPIGAPHLSFCCISFTLFVSISHYQLMLGFCLTHSCQMTHFLTCITLSSFKLATSSHIHGWHSTMIAGVCCTDVEHHLITATVLHGMHFFVNSLCCTSFV